jgi:hypothetical protein
VPKILDRLVRQLEAKGKDASAAHAIATSQLQKHGVLKAGTQELTAKGAVRNAMSPAARARDRAAGATKGGPGPSAYRYDPKRNTARLKRS